MHLATNNITFRVVSGPGRIQGTANGDPHCHEPLNAPWNSAYHGLVRAVVRVTGTAARDEKEKALLGTIDHEGPMVANAPELSVGDDVPIVVEASSPALHPFKLR